MYLINSNLGKQDTEGVWWSNNTCNLSSYKISSSVYDDYWETTYKDKDSVSLESKKSKKDKDDEDYEWYCPNPKCKELLDVYAISEGFCFNCDFCLDCSMSYEDCMCYSSYAKNNDLKSKPGF